MDASKPPTFTFRVAHGLESTGAGGSHDPAPQYRGEDVWAHWEMVDKAYRAVNDSRALLAELELELKAKVEEGEKLTERSSKIFDAVSRKSQSRFPSLTHRKPRPTSQANAAADQASVREEFELVFKEETAVKARIKELTEKIDTLKEIIRNNTGLASTFDKVFELLSSSVASALPAYEMLPSISTENKLAIASQSYNEAEKLVLDIARARVTVQHAHHYYTTVLKTLDSVRGTAVGRVLLGGLGEVSKQQDYGVAVDIAAKAQVCFNETVRVLTPHLSIIPPNILEDYQALKDMGLLQASKIYNYMYGWKSRSTGISKKVEAMLQRQEEVFAKLTRLAVWVQDAVPGCEAQLRASRDARDEIRRELARNWNLERAIVDIRPES